MPGDEATTLEALLDVLPTPVFNRGHLWKMLAYVDPARAEAFLDSTTEALEDALPRLSELSDRLGAQLGARLAKAAADIRRYVQHDRRRVGLPHIGRGRVLGDFASASDFYGLTTNDSITSYKEFLLYLARTCRETRNVVTGLLAVVDGVDAGDPEVRARCGRMRTELEEIDSELEQAIPALDRCARAIEEVLATTTDFEHRRRLLMDRAGSSEEPVAALLAAIAKVRLQTAWLVRSERNTITDVRKIGEFRLVVRFVNGDEREVELGDDYWGAFHGISMDPDRFALVRLDAEANQLVWDGGVRLDGERLRTMMDDGAPRLNG